MPTESPLRAIFFLGFETHAGSCDDYLEHVKIAVEQKQNTTVDPHTTNMMRDIYPKVVDGYDIEVQSYLEVLAEKAPEVLKQCNQELVIHDSCVYARYEDMVDQPRELLKNAGVDIKLPELSGPDTITVSNK